MRYQVKWTNLCWEGCDGAALQQEALCEQAQAGAFCMDKATLGQGVAESGEAGKSFLMI